MSPALRSSTSAIFSIENKRLAPPSFFIARFQGRSFAAAARSTSTSTSSSSEDGDGPQRRRRTSSSSSASSSSSSSSSPSARYSPVKVDEETRLHWQHLLSDLRRPSAARLARNLDLDFVLGLNGAAFSAPPLARFFAAIKQQHPTKIALVRVGEFYECIGADAVLLVEHAALNPMGTGANTMPRAGCPASNLKRTLDDLVRGAALSVVVAEEAPEAYSYGTRARKKERYVAGVVTPAQPHYLVVNSLERSRRSCSPAAARSSSSSLHDDEDGTIGAGTTNDDDDDTIDATPPILGVSAVASASGFTVVEVDVEMRRFSVFRGLTEDAVSARLFSGGLSPPLYLHSPDDSSHPARFADASAEQEWSKRVSTLFRREVGLVKRYGFGGGGGVAGEASSLHPNSSSTPSSSLEPAVAHLLSAVRRDLGLPPNEPFDEVRKGSGAAENATTGESSGPQVYLCTASQLGIHRQRGVPSLLDALLPSGSSSSSSSSPSSSSSSSSSSAAAAAATATAPSRSVPLASRRWLERLLLMPPTPRVALDVRRALEVLASPSLGAVPRWLALPAPHVVLKLRSGEASAGFFRDLVAMLDAVAGVTASCWATAETTTAAATAPAAIAEASRRGEEPGHQLSALAQALLSPTAEETGTRLSLRELADACERAVTLVESTVADVRGGGSGSFGELDSGSLRRKVEAFVPSRALRASLMDLVDANEGAYSGQVHASLLEEELAAVEAARGRVASAAAELVSVVSERAAAKKRSVSSSSTRAAPASPKEPEVIFDAVNNAVWVRMPRGGGGGSVRIGASAAAGEAGDVASYSSSSSPSSSSSSSPSKTIIHPLDRYGRRVADRWSSAELEEALDSYRRRCVAARSAVRGTLRALARELADGSAGAGEGASGRDGSGRASSSSVSTMAGLVSAATFSTIGCALDAHAREAAARGWGLPRLVGVGGEKGGNSGSGGGSGDDDGGKNPRQSAIAITDFWPYWKERRDSEANSIDLRSMALLTGPNMAGKSTVLRSVAACSLLASCGLRAPCAAASVPPLDAIVLRAFAADAPSAGRSSFAVEMDETRHVLAAASSSSSSLILVDELGKGTEPAAGAAVAGAVLESLARERGCLGLFATHLHELLELPLEGFGGGEESGGGGGAGGRRRRQQQQQQQRFCMTTRLDPRSGAKAPAWRLAEGDSTESLAIEVAAEARVDPRVVSRAAELYAALCAAKEASASGRSKGGDEFSSDATVPAVGGGASAVDTSVAPRAEEGVVGLSSRASTRSPSAAAASAPPLFSLEDAAAVLSSAAEAVLKQQQSVTPPPPLPSPSSPRTAFFQAPPPAASLVRAGWSPPPAVVGRSCVYVVRRFDGYFYCGESDDLVARLASHRSRPPVAGGNALEACFVIVDARQGGKSAARAIEAASIRSMARAGLPLLSEADGVHRSGLVAAAAVEGESAAA